MFKDTEHEQRRVNIDNGLSSISHDISTDLSATMVLREGGDSEISNELDLISSARHNEDDEISSLINAEKNPIFFKLFLKRGVLYSVPLRFFKFSKKGGSYNRGSYIPSSTVFDNLVSFYILIIEKIIYLNIFFII